MCSKSSDKAKGKGPPPQSQQAPKPAPSASTGIPAASPSQVSISHNQMDAPAPYKEEVIESSHVNDLARLLYFHTEGANSYTKRLWQSAMEYAKEDCHCR